MNVPLIRLPVLGNGVKAGRAGWGSDEAGKPGVDIGEEVLATQHSTHISVSE